MIEGMPALKYFYQFEEELLCGKVLKTQNPILYLRYYHATFQVSSDQRTWTSTYGMDRKYFTEPVWELVP